jgi:hypothetical protein
MNLRADLSQNPSVAMNRYSGNSAVFVTGDSGTMFEQHGALPTYSSPSMLTLPTTGYIGGSLTPFPYARTGVAGQRVRYASPTF